MSLRVAIAVTHLLGVGHLARAAALARALARAGHEVTLISGGMPAPLVRTDGVRFVQLPPVRTQGTDFRTLLDESSRPIAAEHLQSRVDALRRVVARSKPDVVVTELFPFGRRALAEEFMALITEAKALGPVPLVISSVRDILVAPARPDRIAEIHERLREFYDAVLVHGDPALVSLEASWPLDQSIRSLIRYTGYVDDGALAGESHADGVDEILVSGGGSAASLPLYRAAVAAGALVDDRPWRILVGGGVLEGEFAELGRAAPPNVTVERARPDFRTLLATAAVSVSQAGYNTVIDVLRTRVRAVFVPFEQGNETEQRLRAEHLIDTGFARVLPEGELSARALADHVSGILQQPRPDRLNVRLDGAERSVAAIEELSEQRVHAARVLPRRHSHVWRALDDALARARDSGAALSFWWRDDDAVAPTPELDRLLALAGRFGMPLALAAVPARLEPSLGRRLVGETSVRVLVHGLRHANHAPEGEKKAEFGAHRLLSDLESDAGAGLRLAMGALAGRVLPVFVPPWNRIAPELIPALPGLGFRGLSAFGRRPAPEPFPGLVQVNMHIDPIDWRGGRSLRDPGSVVADIVRLISDPARKPAAAGEPIGILTHHLVHDAAVWGFCEDLFDRLASHPDIGFPALDTIFAGDDPPSSSKCGTAMR